MEEVAVSLKFSTDKDSLLSLVTQPEDSSLDFFIDSEFKP